MPTGVGGGHCLEVSEGRSEKVTLGGRDLPLGARFAGRVLWAEGTASAQPEARKPHSIQEQKEDQCTWNRESEKPLGGKKRGRGQKPA